MVRLGFLLLLVASFVAVPGLLSAQQQLLRQSATVDFPLSLTFRLEASEPLEITQATVRFQVEERSCARVESTGYAELQSQTPRSAQWTWDMRKTGGLPPGAVVHYRWEVTDGSGNVRETPLATVEIMDQRHAWRSIAAEGVTLYWYRGEESFAAALMDTAQEALARLKASTGAVPETPVKLYIYGSTSELQDALVFPQEWTGGVSFNSFNVIVIGIHPDSLAWGKRAMTHELTHSIIGQVTHNCYQAIPAWLSEGLATYNEGEPSLSYAEALTQAISDSRLLSVKSLSGAFPTDAQAAVLAYAESGSLIDHLVRAFGAGKLSDLLEVFRSGSTADAALQRVYGFDQAGLEESWRRSLGAAPAPTAASGEVSGPLVPVLPTFEPFSLATPSPTNAAPALQSSPTPIPTATPEPESSGGQSCSFGMSRAVAPDDPGAATLLLPVWAVALGSLAGITRRRKR